LELGKAPEKQGIITLGKISGRFFDKLAAIKKIGEENSEEIQSCIEAIGLYFQTMDQVVLGKQIDKFWVIQQEIKIAVRHYRHVKFDKMTM